MKKAGIIAFICLVIAGFAISCQSDEQIEYMRYYTGGHAIYQKSCQNCHGKNGEGLSGLMPPLNDTAYMNKNRNRLPCFIKNGLSGIIKVKDKFYDNTMPPSGLSPIEIAKVLTYVGNSFGNKQGLIDLDEVEGSLKECR